MELEVGDKIITKIGPVDFIEVVVKVEGRSFSTIAINYSNGSEDGIRFYKNYQALRLYSAKINVIKGNKKLAEFYKVLFS